MTTTMTDETEHTLLSLHEAADLLQVHSATLRRWADQGLVPSQRTHGGHRRFRRADLHALDVPTPGDSSGVEAELFVVATLGRIHLLAQQGRWATEAWYSMVDEATREEHRALGRRLLMRLAPLLDQSAPSDGRPAADFDEARAIGAEYAALASRRGLAVAEATRALMAFQECLVESVTQITAIRRAPPDERAAITRALRAFLAETLIAMVGRLAEGSRQL